MSMEGGRNVFMNVKSTTTAHEKLPISFLSTWPLPQTIQKRDADHLFPIFLFYNVVMSAYIHGVSDSGAAYDFIFFFPFHAV